MKLKDAEGIYENWVPIGLMIAAVVYVALCIFVFFPLIDKAVG